MYANRKSQIFHVAVDLFAEKTYTHCSMREIAAEVGIKVSSIYNHYPCKEDILQDVLRYYGANYNKYRLTAVEIERLAPDAIADRVLDGLFFMLAPGAENEFLCKVTRIVSNLAYEHADAAKRYHICMFEEPTRYVHGVFDDCIRLDKLASFDTEMFAYLLISMVSRAFAETLLEIDVASRVRRIRRWTKETIQNHAISSQRNA